MPAQDTDAPDLVLDENYTLTTQTTGYRQRLRGMVDADQERLTRPSW